MKTLISTVALIATLCSNNTYALRCSTEIISEGDSINKVTRACENDISDEYRVKNNQADINNVTVKKDGMNCEMQFIDGSLKSIDCNR